MEKHKYEVVFYNIVIQMTVLLTHKEVVQSVFLLFPMSHFQNS